jgi:hypothetical protein
MVHNGKSAEFVDTDQSATYVPYEVGVSLDRAYERRSVDMSSRSPASNRLSHFKSPTILYEGLPRDLALASGDGRREA